MSEAFAATLPARPDLNTRSHAAGAVGVGYTLYGLVGDIEAVHTPPVAVGALVLLGIALLIALGFEFVNGFHDTANAVATVIYTHSLPAHLAVVWSGVFNFLGVMVSSGAVAFSVLSLLPVELILQVGGSAGFAMIFALLTATSSGIWGPGGSGCRRVRRTP
jgi:PiT family inorganic phosphate transporter